MIHLVKMNPNIRDTTTNIHHHVLLTSGLYHEVKLKTHPLVRVIVVVIAMMKNLLTKNLPMSSNSSKKFALSKNIK
jgi:hypothetical protein